MISSNPAATVGRRALLLGAASLLAAPATGGAAELRDLTIYKTPYCNCCEGWVAHMGRAGFITRIKVVEDIGPIRSRFGVPFAISSCHTGRIGPYVVEGHVPAADVIRLLREQPKALGLVVPGMPLGSPGMETASGVKEPFQTLLLLDRSGRTRVYARHA